MRTVATAYALTASHIRDALTELAERSDAVARALTAVGFPEERRREQGFGALTRIIIGQQVSTAAAAAIAERVDRTLGGQLSPDRVMATRDEDLRSAGLSPQKLGYLRALSQAVSTGALPIERLAVLSDAEVIEAITAIRGFGVWSAQMYLMFSLGRPDIWPGGDLAVRAGFSRMLDYDERLSPQETARLSEVYAPYRSALALLCWKYYSEAPL